MKNYVGRKIRGFRFGYIKDVVVWNPSMKKHIGEVGEIMGETEELVRVQFTSDTWAYPISLIEPHLIEEETPEIIDLSHVNGVEMMVGNDNKRWVRQTVVATVHNRFIDNQANVWYYAKPILPKYTHAELVEKLGHDFEII
jgi:hypothetical protein